MEEQAPALTDCDCRDRSDMSPSPCGTVGSDFADEPIDPDSYTLDTDEEDYETDELELELTSDEEEEYRELQRMLATLTPFSPPSEGQTVNDEDDWDLEMAEEEARINALKVNTVAVLGENDRE